jgi:hypothetical protein
VALANIGALIVVNLLFTFVVPNVSVGAHVGGLVAGVIVGAFVIWLDTRVPSAIVGSALCAAVTVALVVGCIWAADHWYDPIL